MYVVYAEPAKAKEVLAALKASDLVSYAQRCPERRLKPPNKRR